MNGCRIHITGTVQGVGMRPFIYNLARRLHIRGSVRNDTGGVDIFAAGDELEAFIRTIRNSPPPLARIEKIETSDVDVPDAHFSIVGSLGAGSNLVDVGIDAAVCPDCLTEFFDKNNRRFQYTFINCTNCGPRYTIITGLPYDREKTSMAPFPMCPDCRREYDDPADRRFHAQGNCCPACGPRYYGVERAISLLEAGSIVAIKGLGGYHLACNADNREAVLRLRTLKHRDEKPFAIMVRETDLPELLPAEKALLSGIERPILLVDHVHPTPIAPGLNTIGIMLPYTPLHHLLFARGSFRRLIMTSGNRSSEPMAVRNGEIIFRDIADFVLEHDREIVVRNDDSVIRVMGGAPIFLRRSRGFAPGPVSVDFDATGFVGIGAMLKNTIALGRGRQIYLSQYIGDLQNEETYDSLASTYKHMVRMYGINPKAVVCDLHPDFLSTRFAQSLKIPVVRIQHHVAHAYACMAENRLTEAVAVVYDGTGFGEDGLSWGGEIFCITEKGAIREAHLSYMPMPGGDVCVDHPLRLAAGALHTRGILLPGMEDVIELIKKNVNLFRTSGMGRLFDAASALLSICTEQTYEGQAPMMLEAATAPLSGAGSYKVTPFDSAEILEALYRDEAQAPLRAARFHNTVIEMTAAAVRRIAGEKGIRHAVLSGGCFQNRLLVEGLIKQLQDDISVHTHRLVPPNDGGISFGQIAAASKEYR